MSTLPTDEADRLSEEEQQELIDELERRRSPRGIASLVVIITAIAFSAFQMWLAARGFIFAVTIPGIGQIKLAALQLLQVNAIHVIFALLLAFLLYPPSTGNGPVARRLGRVVPALERRFGAKNPVTRTMRGVRSIVRWLFMDPNRERVTPVDIVCMGIAILAGLYMLTSFDEIRQIRVLGIDSARTIGEFVPALAPVVDVISSLGIALDTMSVAFLLGAAGVLLVLEATRRSLGIYLTLIVVTFIVYAKYGYLIPSDGIISTPFGFGIIVPYIDILWIQPGDWGTIIQNFWYNTENGVFGIPVTVSVQFIYIFILFGAFLEMSGAGQWFIDFAYAVTGKRKGGPAKASVLSSGFMGAISGSSIANTVTTGAFTIPLMKRSGYRSEFAGAVEASASSGGQILPPVMGAAAFLIVEYTTTPYANVIAAAAVPAIVFFFGVWVMVHLEASKAGITQIDESSAIALRPHLRKGWFYLLPITALLYYLIIARLSVARSAWFSIVAIIAVIAVVAVYNDRTKRPLFAGIVGLFLLEFIANLLVGTGLAGLLLGSGGSGQSVYPALAAAAEKLGTIAITISAVTLLVRPSLDTPWLDYDEAVDEGGEATADALSRPSLSENNAYRFGAFVLRSMEHGARTATPVVIAVAAVGIVPGVLSATGLAPNLTTFIKTLAGGSLVLLLIITAIAAIILGMGVPTTATYILLAAVLAPAIIESSSMPLLAAHLFILYFGVIADITPPVAVAAYAASGIAKSDPFSTGVEAFSLSLNKAIVPFAFALTPGLLLLRPTENGEAHIIGLADVLDFGYFVPEVAIPIICLFTGVLALGPTIIGYFYTDVSPSGRALFALTALLLMTPLALFNLSTTLFDVLTPFAVITPPFTELALRAVGAVLFIALVLQNRRSAEEHGSISTPESTTD
ncbi:TRAP transporter permease [Halocatena marina]|uniref:TRAP transporter permease n=1 Tax=Halocatena marina TaxID=2934937 RepID=UPI00200EAEE9|nr:TRAP transporter fused permease subunit [Halocatena marina]